MQLNDVDWPLELYLRERFTPSRASGGKQTADVANWKLGKNESMCGLYKRIG